MSSFCQHLQESLGEHKQDEIQELLLDEFIQTEELTLDHKETLEKYESLIHLTLNGIGLKSLKNFPELESLQILELVGNKLTGDDFDIIVKACPNLYKIKLDDNQIESFDNIEKLKGLELKKINLNGNPITDKEDNYRKKLFEMITTLESVDDQDKDGNEVESTIYGDEGEEEEDSEGEEIKDDDDEEGEEMDDDVLSGEEGEEAESENEDNEDDEENEEEDESPNKKKKF